MPTGGNVIYGVAHQHTGGIGSTLYGEDGRFLCSSIPTYRQGKEAGSEEGYIVRMSTWYPNPGSVKISDGETIVLESIYNRSQSHGGVMGLFYILVADDMSPNNPNSVVHSPVEVRSACKPLKALGIHTVSLHPGASIDHQIHGLKSCEPEFLVSTPERLLELLSLKAIDISGVSLLILCLIAMEKPISLTPEHIRDEKVKVHQLVSYVFY